MQREKPEYGPDDARNMSPRRNSHEIDMLGEEVRENLKKCVYAILYIYICRVTKLTRYIVKHELYNHHSPHSPSA